MVAQLILSLSILVVLHELGHFIPAKLFHTRVEKFYLFFIIRHNLKNRNLESIKKSSEDHVLGTRSFLIFILLLGFGMIFFAGEMLSSSVELFL